MVLEVSNNDRVKDPCSALDASVSEESSCASTGIAIVDVSTTFKSIVRYSEYAKIYKGTCSFTEAVRC